MMSITLFWRHSFRLAIFYVALAALLTFIFFRRRKIAFAMVALSFLIVNVGLTALFHPTPGGVLITLGSIAAMFVLVRSEEHTSELQSLTNLVCRLLLEKK